ncbi:hypothetical protein TSOC_011833 [Tetrabaena socialis]|uniref:Uncharacterized protein n=1 Tax=Tetrabaena socialis TaxID=47790 RepID=A0A2J7ZPM8_9CHLO|nr:hypothetical protein TSOC_011833 [Tetrabaena socialis]|eukprot:PNH02218.1 hypothetical protein TSOC_011833 [Tetrabaena socialis]
MAARKPIIAVMGPGKTERHTEPVDKHVDLALELGKQIGAHGWLLLTGGRNVGVMDAACRGAKSSGGTTIGILPGPDFTDLSAPSRRFIAAAGAAAGSVTLWDAATGARRTVLEAAVTEVAPPPPPPPPPQSPSPAPPSAPSDSGGGGGGEEPYDHVSCGEGDDAGQLEVMTAEPVTAICLHDPGPTAGAASYGAPPGTSLGGGGPAGGGGIASGSLLMAVGGGGNAAGGRAEKFFASLDASLVHVAADVEAAVTHIKALLP